MALEQWQVLRKSLDDYRPVGTRVALLIAVLATAPSGKPQQKLNFPEGLCLNNGPHILLRKTKLPKIAVTLAARIPRVPLRCYQTDQLCAVANGQLANRESTFGSTHAKHARTSSGQREFNG